MSILTMGIVSIILVTSQPPAAFAGGCIIEPNSDCDGDGFTPNQGDCDDFQEDVFPGDGLDCPLLVIQDLQDIFNQVDAMLASGELDINKGQTNAILGKLDQAMDKLNAGNNNAAIGSLNAFINQINAFINSGSISSGNGGLLISTTQSLINSL